MSTPMSDEDLADLRVRLVATAAPVPARMVRELLAAHDELARYKELDSLYEELQRTALALDKAAYFFEFDRAGPPVLSGDALVRRRARKAAKAEEHRRASEAYRAEHARLFGERGR